jgi:hypothetical protein
MEHSIGIPEHTKASILDHEETVPTGMVHIDDPDRTGEILCALAQDLFGRIDEHDSDSFFLRLLQLERHAGLRELAPLECGGTRRWPSCFDVGLVLEKFLLRFVLPPGPEERLGQ